ncbi:hypothetical protein JAAARDRAFT_37133 [Jaapia argillacea MUCL 33604]|uniref:HIT-type domain-containing protein n=1 Tax=Jaapia argillacea MUCL 33604 TaxID=933084 RepID=A0A067PLE3_9AGAM|nr:hypothetical protein JAAARDRAFT_37133 [Jaapia argillacea MUCL 33604]
MIVYCSVGCFKSHKERICVQQVGVSSSISDAPAPPLEVPVEESIKPTDSSELLPSTSNPPLRRLTSLNWPYVPEESAYPDPLKRNDPKPLQLRQYEAIATSPAIRKALLSHPSLPTLLRSIDSLRGADREDALQRALGVSNADDLVGGRKKEMSREEEEERDALRALAEAVEGAVRGGKEGLGLDWGDGEQEE